MYCSISIISVAALSIGYRLSAIAYRLSLIGYRLSAIAYRLSPIAYRLSPIASPDGQRQVHAELGQARDIIGIRIPACIDEVATDVQIVSIDGEGVNAGAANTTEGIRLADGVPSAAVPAGKETRLYRSCE
ncbi:MAG: hypothetical protein K6T87_01455 [Roseiflexus sp.]|uniref:hypothetical protein n=1 Tax=Roseiflexus sp. TaxID=2562120 RepID=UPI0025E57F86|nr:hypothetical protein [Roseiflexus sp.]MCL6539253.1 hypothetical protein [Roseiflexus sp.]